MTENTSDAPRSESEGSSGAGRNVRRFEQRERAKQAAKRAQRRALSRDEEIKLYRLLWWAFQLKRRWGRWTRAGFGPQSIEDILDMIPPPPKPVEIYTRPHTRM